MHRYKLWYSQHPNKITASGQQNKPKSKDDRRIAKQIKINRQNVNIKKKRLAWIHKCRIDVKLISNVNYTSY
jgi:hypothetical protein